MIMSNMEKVESKYFNTNVINGVPPVTGQLYTSTLPSQGSTNGEREGDSLELEWIEARVLMYNLADITTSSNATDAVRLLCLQARASNAVTLSYSAAPTTGVFDLGVSGAIDITSFVNMNARNETFHVLYDTTHPIGFLSSTSFKNINLKIRPKVNKINFTPTTTNALMGQIYWITISQQGGTTTCALEQRLVYRDL
jgi:hypothetical protein